MRYKNVSFFALVWAMAAPAAFSETGFFNCTPSPAGLTECRLAKSTVEGSQTDFQGEPYLGTYIVNYNFSCFPGGYDSNIVLHAGSEGSSKSILIYSDEVYKADFTRQVTIEGPGPLQLRDRDPLDTSYAAFAPGCGLSISYTVAPSLAQTSSWLSEVQGIVDGVNATTPLSDIISDVKIYYEANLVDPVSTAGFLNSQILGLRQAGASKEDLDRANAYESILKGIPLDTVLQPLNAAFTTLKATYQRGLKLKAKLEFAGEKNVVQLEQALARAEKIVNK